MPHLNHAVKAISDELDRLPGLVREGVLPVSKAVAIAWVLVALAPAAIMGAYAVHGGRADDQVSVDGAIPPWDLHAGGGWGAGGTAINTHIFVGPPRPQLAVGDERFVVEVRPGRIDG